MPEIDPGRFKRFKIYPGLPEYYAPAFYEGGRRLCDDLGLKNRVLDSRDLEERLSHSPQLRSAINAYIADGHPKTDLQKYKEAADYLNWLESKSQRLTEDYRAFTPTPENRQSYLFQGYMRDPKGQTFLDQYNVNNPRYSESPDNKEPERILNPELKNCVPLTGETIFHYLDRVGGDGELPLLQEEALKAYYGTHTLVRSVINYKIDVYDTDQEDVYKGTALENRYYETSTAQDKFVWHLKGLNLRFEVDEMESRVAGGYYAKIIKELQGDDLRMLDLLNFLGDLQDTGKLSFSLKLPAARVFMRWVALRLAQNLDVKTGRFLEAVPSGETRTSDVCDLLPQCGPWLELAAALETFEQGKLKETSDQLERIFMSMRDLERSAQPREDFRNYTGNLKQQNPTQIPIQYRCNFWLAWTELFQCVEARRSNPNAKTVSDPRSTIQQAFLLEWNHRVSSLIGEGTWPGTAISLLSVDEWIKVLTDMQFSPQHQRYFWPEIRDLFPEVIEELHILENYPNLYTQVPSMKQKAFFFVREGKAVRIDPEGDTLGYWNGIDRGFLVLNPVIKRDCLVFRDFYYFNGHLTMPVWDYENWGSAFYSGENRPFGYFEMDFARNDPTKSYMRTINTRKCPLTDGRVSWEDRNEKDVNGLIDFPTGHELKCTHYFWHRGAEERTYRLGEF